MESMTEEEAFALDEYYTNNPPRVDPSKARIRIPVARVDRLTAEPLPPLSRGLRKTPEEIIGEPAQERVAAAI